MIQKLQEEEKKRAENLAKSQEQEAESLLKMLDFKTLAEQQNLKYVNYSIFSTMMKKFSKYLLLI